MSRDNDRSRNTWDEEDDTADPPDSFRDAYLNAAHQNRSHFSSSDTPQDDPFEGQGRSGGRNRPRSGSGGGRIYEEGSDQPARPRPTRQSRDEVYARHRQRPRQPVYARNQDETGSRPPGSVRRTARSSSRDELTGDYLAPPPEERRGRDAAYPAQSPASGNMPRRASNVPNYRDRQPYGEYEEVDEYEIEPSPRRRSTRRGPEPYGEYEEVDEYEIEQPRRQSARREPPRRRRRGGGILSHLFVGCLGGVITLVVVIGAIVFLIAHNTSLGQSLPIGKTTYTKQVSQPLTLGGVTRLIVTNQVGSVAVNVSSGSADATLNATKKVLASSTTDANSQFSQATITVKQVQQGATPACTASQCLLVTTSVPASDGGSFLSSGSTDSIDLTITLPSSFSDPSMPYTLVVSTATGNIAVNGFNGILDLSGSTGSVNIGVSNSVIFAGSCLQTTHGNVTVNKGSIFDLDTPSQVVPCTNTTSKSSHPWFNVSSGKGDVDITLSTLSTNLLLNASTLNGKITDDFGLTISSCGGSPCYSGPLLPDNGGPAPVALLYISASTGNIQLQKQ